MHGLSSVAVRTASLRRKAAVLTVLSVVAAGLPAVAPATAHASSPAAGTSTSENAVIVWDRVAENAIYDVAGHSPQFAPRGFAMVHGAVYDAVNAIAGKPYQPYLIAPRADGTESTDAAVATAAFRVLVSLFPDQQASLRTRYDEALAAIPDGRPKTRGIAVGTRTADAMIAARQGDGAWGDQTWAIGDQPGQWRPTPPTNTAAGAWIAYLKPFFLPDAAMFRTSGPPPLNGRRYARDFHEVKSLGAANSTVRTQDQTEAAIWWHDQRVVEWEIKRQLATTQGLNTLQTARMLAMVDLAEMDATIACYNEKAAWNFWRPITAIRLADTDGNPDTPADPTWTPLLVTPPHPDYTSGHACFTAASMFTLKHFFGRDDIPFSGHSAASGTTRHFTGFSQALEEVINARIWGGIHTRAADEEGAKLGKKVAKYMIKNFFKPRRR